MKQNIIQSIIRRGLSFVFLSLLMPLGVGAQTNYDLWIGNTQVTSENAGDVLGDGKVAEFMHGDQHAEQKDPQNNIDHSSSQLFDALAYACTRTAIRLKNIRKRGI